VIYGLLTHRQRLRATHELQAHAAKVHAFLSWIDSEIGRSPAATVHGQTAPTLADEANYPDAAAFALWALSKKAFWNSQNRRRRVRAMRL
jgi:hypothetical protein